MRFFNFSTRILLTTAAIFVWVLQGLAQDPTEFTDPQFNNGVSKYYYPTTYASRITDMEMLDDDRIILVGSGQTSYLKYDWVVIGLKADGNVDSTFGDDGYLFIDFGTDTDICEAVDRMSDGSLLLTGSADKYQGLVLKITPEGRIDSTFGTNGHIEFLYTGWSYNGHNYDIKVAADDSFYLTGYRYDGANKQFMVARFDRDGVMDSDFGDNGFVFLNFGSSEDYGQRILIQDDGKLLVLGQSAYYLRIVRLHSNGAIDSTYGIDGVASADFRVYQTSGDIYRGAFQSDGKLVVAGYGHYSDDNSSDMAAVRFTTEGKIDSTFGLNGHASVDFKGGGDEGHAILIGDKDRIFIGGRGTLSNKQSRLGIAAFNADGQLDTTFAHQGIGTTYGYRIMEMRFSADDKITVSGHNSQNGGFTLSRFQSHKSTTSIGEHNVVSVQGIELYQNYPNPFNPNTSITYRLPENSGVKLSVYDSRGRLLQILVNKTLPAGSYTVPFSAEKLASGLYYYQLEADGLLQTKRMLLIK